MKLQGQYLTIRTTITPSGTLGYGYLYKCVVKEILEGELEEKNINLIVLANDHDNIEFLAAHNAPAEIEIAFRLKKTNEPYARMPLTGFVDKNMTSWEIITMK